MSRASVHDREAGFHDQWAASTDLRAVRVREAFEAPTAMENAWILDAMGPLAGKRLLDVGAGLGESSVYFALRGAEVTTSDLSPGMVDLAVKLGQLHGVKLHGIVAAGEELGVPENHFDFVYSANTLHHVADKAQFFGQIRRALKPGGRFFTWDPLAYNPLINFYRGIATNVRTEDESPLTFRDVALAQRFFCEVEHREFWITTLALFCKYFAIDRIDPNEKRYWKLIYEETPRRLWWWRPLRALDNLLTRLPLVRGLAWNMVMTGRRPLD